MLYIKKKKRYNSLRGGYITLISVLIVGAVGLSIATSLLLLGLNSSRTSFVNEQSAKARSLSNACVEKALQEIRNSVSYSGGDNFLYSTGSCSYFVTNTGGENREIIASGFVGTISRKTKIEINKINPQIEITTWVEVSDF